jgi:hypothetical protein
MLPGGSFTQKGNVLVEYPAGHEAAARTEDFHCRCADQHGGISGRPLPVNFFPAEKFPNHRHFEFQRHRETGARSS